MASKMKVDFLVNKNKKGVACPYCGLVYSQRGNVSKHIKTAHLDQRPHVCKLCPSSFHFADGLQRHMTQVHDRKPRPFVCSQCGAGFQQRCHLSKHTNSVHRSGRSSKPP